MTKKRKYAILKREKTKRGGLFIKILISACLLGTPCRYDGRSKPIPDLLAWKEKHCLFLVCPECDGGLSVPRPPAERCGERVCTVDGKDVTEAYQNGARHALAVAKKENISLAILKERSPSCGTHTVYDGTFRKVLTARHGVCAQLLLENGIEVIGETEALHRIALGLL